MNPPYHGLTFKKAFTRLLLTIMAVVAFALPAKADDVIAVITTDPPVGSVIDEELYTLSLQTEQNLSTNDSARHPYIQEAPADYEVYVNITLLYKAININQVGSYYGITTPGRYHIVIPAGYLLVDGDPTTQDLVLTYYVNCDPSEFGPDEPETSTPVPFTFTVAGPQTPITEISEITLTGVAGTTLAQDATKGNITLTGATTNNVHTASVSVSGNVATLTFYPAITAADTYTLSVPEGRFYYTANGVNNPNNAVSDVQYTIEAPVPFTFTVAGPQAPITEISEITLTGVAGTILAQDATKGNVTLTGATTGVHNAAVSVSGNVATLTFYPAINAADTYTLSVPEGRFYYTANGVNNPNNAVSDVQYTIQAAQNPDPDPVPVPFEFTVVGPEAPITEISQISLIGKAGTSLIYIASLGNVTLTGATTGVHNAAVSVSGNHVATLKFNPAITAADTYTLSVPEGIFYYYIDGVENPNIAVSGVQYTIEATQNPDDPEPPTTGEVVLDITTTPASGEVVEVGLRQISITTTQNLSENPSAQNRPYVREARDLYNVFINFSYFSTDINIQQVGSYSGITTPGIYHIVIPAGFLCVDNNPTTQDYELTYYVGVEPTTTFSFRATPNGLRNETSLHIITLSAPEDAELSVDDSKGSITFNNHTDVFTILDNYNQVIIRLNDEITEEGEYTLIVPAERYSYTFNGINYLSEAVEITYIVSNAAAAPQGESFDFIVEGPEAPITKISTITLKAPEGVSLSDYDPGIITLTGANTGTHYPSSVNTNYNEVTLTFDPAITAADTYTLSVPAGRFCYYSANYAENLNNAVSEQYTINAASGSDGVVPVIFTNPPTDTNIDSFGSRIDYTTNQTLVYNSNSDLEPYIQELPDYHVNIYTLEVLGLYIYITSDGSTGATITTPGIYHIVFPAGYFIVNDEVSTQPLVLTYYVKTAVPDTEPEIEIYTPCDPEFTYTKIDKVRIYFNDFDNSKLEPNTDCNEAITITKKGTDTPIMELKSTAMAGNLSKYWSEEHDCFFAFADDGEGNVQEITEAGTYVLKIPARFFKYVPANAPSNAPAKRAPASKSSDGTKYSKETEVEFTVDPNNSGGVTTGVESIEADANADSTTIFNLQGIPVMRNADSNSLRNLAPGVYIVGGKKVMIRK